MSTDKYYDISKLPSKKGDPAIPPGANGPAIQEVQKILQKTKQEVDRQKYLSDFGKGYSLLDEKHYSFFDIETSRALKDFQEENKTEIMSYGQLDPSGFTKELNTIGYPTWKALLRFNDGIQYGVKEVVPQNNVSNNPKNIEDHRCTHFVRTKNKEHRLAVRDSFSNEYVSVDSDKDVDKKGALIDFLENGVEVQVVDPYIGYDGQWSEIIVLSQDVERYKKVLDFQKQNKIFCFMEFLEKANDNIKILPFVNVKKKKFSFDNDSDSKWQTLSECEPYYNSSDDSYNICISLEDTKINKEQVDDKKKNVLLIGIDKLLAYYNKQRYLGDFTEYSQAIGFAKIPEDGIFLSDRPGSTVKMLVKVYAKFFDAIAKNNDIISDVGDVSKLKILSISNLQLKKNIDIFCNELKKCQQEYKDSSIVIDGLDFEREISRIYDFYNKLQTFFNVNEYDFDETDDEQIEIGFNGDTFTILYILLNKGYGSFRLSCGERCFFDTSPMKYSRTMGFIFYLPESVKEIKKGRRPWVDFLQSYSTPLFNISPSKNKKTNIDNISTTNDIYKTSSQKSREDLYVNNLENKRAVRNNNSQRVDFVGDSLLNCDNIKTLLVRLRNFDDIYKNVLGKIGIEDLSLFVIRCIASKLLPLDLAEAICKDILNKLPLVELEQLLDLFTEENALVIQQRFAENLTSHKFRNTQDARRRALVNAYEISVAKEELCSAIRKLNPRAFLAAFERLMSVYTKKKYKTPTVRVPDNLNIEDIMESIASEIERALKAILNNIFVSLIKEALSVICDFCYNKQDSRFNEKYGDRNLNNDIRKGGYDPREVYRKNLSKFPFTDRGLRVSENDLKDFIDDLSALLLPREFCLLLEGNIDTELRDIIFNLLKRKYTVLYNIFIKDETLLYDFFASLYNFIDKSICNDLINTDRFYEDLCSLEEYNENNLRENLLNDKLPADQVKKQLDLQKEKDKQKMSKFIDLLDDDFVQNLFPNIDGVCINGSKVSSIIPKTHPSYDYLKDRVYQSIFDGIKSSFNIDIEGFVNALTIFGKDSGRNLLDDEKVSKEEFTTIHNILYKKELSSRTDDDRKRLLENPDGTTFRKKDEYKKVLPDLVKIIENGDVIRHISYPLSYTFENAYFFNNKIIKDSGLSAISKVVEALQEQSVDVANKLFCEISGGKYEKDTKERFKENINIIYEITRGDVYRNDVAEKVRFSFGNKKREESIEVIDLFSDNFKNFFQRYSTDFSDVGLSINQIAFYSIIKKIWSPVVNNKEMFEQGTIFYNYFNGELFHKINELLYRKMFRQIAKSEYFYTKNLKELFYGSSILNKSNASCLPNGIVNFLGLDEIFSTESRKTESNSTACPSMEDTFKDSVLNSCTAAYIRVYIVENILKGIFSYSLYGINGLMGDVVFVNFIINKIKSSIKGSGGWFYDNLCLKIKDIYGKDAHLTDPLLDVFGENGEFSKRLKNQKSSEFQSGEIYLEYMIRDQLKGLEKNIDSILRKKTEDIGLSFCLDVFSDVEEIGLRTLSRESGSRIERESGGFFIYVLGIRVLMRADLLIKEYYRGNFYFEKYVHVLSENGKDVDYYESIDEFKNGKIIYSSIDSATFRETIEKCGKVGLRLMYFPPTGFEEENKDFVKFMKENVKYNSDVISKSHTYVLDNGDTHPFPICFEEYDETISTIGINNVDFESIILSLKYKTAVNDTYKAVFEYIYPLNRIFSVSSIYIIEAFDNMVANSGFLFGNTKSMLRNIILNFLPSSEEWWKGDDKTVGIDGGNVNKREELMKNVTTNGVNPNLFNIAAMTVPIIVKGLAERFDSSYGLMKRLYDAGAIDEIGWSQIYKVAPVNLFFPVGFGPPITALGGYALSVDMLPGEYKTGKEREENEKQKQIRDGKEVCKKENK